MSPTGFHRLQEFDGLGGLHDGLRSPDAESLRSFTETIQDEYHEWVSESGRSSRTDQLLDNFPQPPRQESLDAIEEEEMEVYPTPKPSIKNLRRHATANELPLLQQTNPNEGAPEFNPVSEENGSYDLIAPYDGGDLPLYKLERIADIMFSSEHMLTILNNPRYLARFRDFLLEERPRSMSTLTYYLNASKALKAIQYANALVRLSVDVPPPVVQTDGEAAGVTMNRVLEQRVIDGLLALTAEELPAFITSRCIAITSKIVEERVRGTLPIKFRGTSNALAEVFCLTDPSRPDNPIIFASHEFHRTTQYGMDYVLGRNCRFLQGPKTNANSVRRLREAIHAGRHHSEMFLNYRRDGSPFMNLLQCAPLCDSHGRVKYFVGAQIDVSGLAMEGASMESLMELQSKY
ncbi:Nitrogen fixation negative regulator NifL [Penicillium camemberti]|uniref:Nitrogen fixation negative regulator NifL n=1 Tax=Penicillium camemberti (strain FM 013) TaxID=1429867 RepID=A0A0G4PAT6_PENC3|nr:Nitrogen fixation negative regulator NifL [Penicillium camemberti]